MRGRRALVLVATFATLVSACFLFRPDDRSYSCNDGKCPPGQTCGDDHICAIHPLRFDMSSSSAGDLATTMIGDGGVGDLSFVAPPGSQMVTVYGSSFFVSDGNEVDKPRDFTQVPIEVQTPIGGTLVAYHPSSVAGGKVTFTGLPNTTLAQPFYLRIGSVYTLETSSSLMADQSVLGRLDRIAATSAAVSNFNITGLSTWQMSDHLEVFSAGASAFQDSAQNNAGGPLPGSPEIKLLAYLPFLVDGSKGDIVWIAQLRASTLGDGTQINALTKVWSTSAFVQSPTAQTSVTDIFSGPPANRMFTVTWMRSQFRSAVLKANANAVDCVDKIYLAAQPGFFNHGSFSDEPDVLIATAQDGTSDISLTGVGYLNPYPTSWGETATVETTCAVAIAGPAGATSVLLHNNVLQFATLAQLNVGTTTTPLAPLAQPTLAGLDAYAYHAGVGLTPTIAWQPPPADTVDRVYVDITSIDEIPGHAALIVATLSTGGSITSTSLRVPSGVLQPGKRYASKLTAIKFGSDGRYDSVTTALASFTP
jgi:hypothetical protein